MNSETQIHSLSLPNDIEGLGNISQFLEELSEQWQLDPAFSMKLNLVLEEAFSNIVKYAYQDSKAHTIDISFLKAGDTLKISLTDDGIAYDPLQRDDPDTTLPAEEREIGGLGILLIRKMMDKVSYERKENANVLSMEKKIPGI